ncbi:MMPL family transporter [Streptomyces sp. NPDC005385]|uniref:MMPL family transporter n=1 Tax=Streptomyces sp. NPDC005385 TaxID=3157039 RepID=UPI0033A23C8B
MATFLYQLSRAAFRRRRLVAMIWLALLACAAVGASMASSNVTSSFSLPGTEAQKAAGLVETRFPGSSPEGAVAQIVLKAPAPGKVSDPVRKATVKDLVEDLRSTSDQVATVTDPYAAGSVSPNGSTTFVSVTYDKPPGSLSEATLQSLDDVASGARTSGLTAEVGGTALQAAPEPGIGEVIGVVIAAVVLVITLGSLVAAGLPLLTAIFGVGIGIATIAALASTFDLGSTTSTLAMMIGLAVGIDYALFIVSRYRAELAEGHDREEAVGRAVGTAGSAVVFAGLTVVIALVGLAVANVPMLTKMGFAAAGTVVIAVLIALTAIPALLGFVNRRVSPRTPGRTAQKPNGGVRWARFVLRRPAAVLTVGLLGLGVIAIPAASLQVGLPDDGSQPVSTTQRKAYDLLSEGFGPGYNGPLVVVVDGGRDTAAATRATLQDMDGVASVSPATVNKAGDTAMITVVPQDRPSSVGTERLVHSIRDTTSDHVLVTGTTAMNVDFSQRMNDALVPYLTLVVGLAFLLLMLVFRSVLVPLKAALGFLLSVAAALGAVVAVFQWGWLGSLFGVEQTGPIMSMMPIFMVGVVFGLAMDYEVFLVSRMRESYVAGDRPGTAVVTGFQHGARVVTAAAVIMIAVFSGFVGSSEPMIKMIGFGLAVAVFIDAFVVRMAVVPAVLALLGHKAWWLPRWLDRLLPDVDVEGEKLRARLRPVSEGVSPEEPDEKRQLSRV